MKLNKVRRAVVSILEGKDIRKTITESFYSHLSDEYVDALTKLAADEVGGDYNIIAENEPFIEIFAKDEEDEDGDVSEDFIKGFEKRFAKYDIGYSDYEDGYLVFSFEDSGRVTNNNIKELFPNINSYLN